MTPIVNIIAVKFVSVGSQVRICRNGLLGVIVPPPRENKWPNDVWVRVSGQLQHLNGMTHVQPLGLCEFQHRRDVENTSRIRTFLNTLVSGLLQGSPDPDHSRFPGQVMALTEDLGYKSVLSLRFKYVKESDYVFVTADLETFELPRTVLTTDVIYLPYQRYDTQLHQDVYPRLRERQYRAIHLLLNRLETLQKDQELTFSYEHSLATPSKTVRIKTPKTKEFIRLTR